MDDYILKNKITPAQKKSSHYLLNPVLMRSWLKFCIPEHITSVWQQNSVAAFS